jgi:hypothetical protein
MSEEHRPLLPPEPGRCSRCGGPISETAPDVRLFHRDFPDPHHAHWFHPACAASAWELAEKIPHTWSAIERVPDDHSDLPPLPPAADVCALCGDRISPAEPDVVLLHSTVAEQIHRFHEKHGWAAYQLVEADPEEWGLIHRRPDPEAN